MTTTPANVAADGRVAIAVIDHARPFTMASVRGRIVEQVTGERAWQIIDAIATVYTDAPYPDHNDRVVHLIAHEPVTTSAH